MALLELMKMKQIVCYQQSLFDEIVIQAKAGGERIDIPSNEIDY
jgi:segregation and condensation protein A